MKNKLLLAALAILFISFNSLAQKKGKFTDKRDKKTYETVQIGTQIWMAENLAFKTDTGCWAYNNKPENVETYGYLYTWYNAQNVCPLGWKLPAEEDWKILEISLGMTPEIIENDAWRGNKAGGKLKEADTIHWSNPNKEATNETGFTALPGGYRVGIGEFFDIRNVGVWWSSTEKPEVVGDFEEEPEVLTINGCYRGLGYDYGSIAKNCMQKNIGLSVRCVKE